MNITHHPNNKSRIYCDCHRHEVLFYYAHKALMERLLFSGRHTKIPPIRSTDANSIRLLNTAQGTKLHQFPLKSLIHALVTSVSCRCSWPRILTTRDLCDLTLLSSIVRRRTAILPEGSQTVLAFPSGKRTFEVG
jgi:hypothetical protein